MKFKIMKIHHIGIACENIKQTVDDFSATHNVLDITDIIYDESQRAFLCLLRTKEGLNVEFISGPVVKDFVKKKICYCHLCYEVEDLQKTIDNFINNGAKLISLPKTEILFDYRNVASLWTSYGIDEILELEKTHHAV
jgi:methylmalonyl-CoA/ethylmalonyl-CoA epimerase